MPTSARACSCECPHLAIEQRPFRPKFGSDVAHRESEPAKSHAVPVGLALERRGQFGSIGIKGWRKKRPAALNYLHIEGFALMITETLTDS